MTNLFLDLLLEAKSGTGKTAVFSIIILEKLDLTKGLQAVILAPTREIAAQICDVTKQIGSHYEGLNVEVVMGGLPIQDDISKFQNKVHIVVASPGRFRHLIQDKHIDVSSVRILVLDEADKLMEKSFQPDIKYIFSNLPKQKQIIMSSATYSESAKNFISNFVVNAQHIRPNTDCVLLGVDQKVAVVKNTNNVVKQTRYKFQELIKIFTTRHFKQCLIFCNYQVRVSELHKLLIANKWPAEQLYGLQEQAVRLEALKTLQEYKCRILICTDLAARGIDASNIDLVINFDPLEWQTYLHRIGRAGRYGSYGMSITILSEGHEEESFKKIVALVKTSLTLRDLWSDKEIISIIQSDKPQLEENEAPGFLELKNNFIESNTKYEELWNMLSKDHTDNKIENFEDLCTSFDNDAKNSFCTLIESFQTNEDKQHPPDNSDYNHLNIEEIVGENMSTALRSLKNTDYKETSLNVHEENDIEQGKNISIRSNSVNKNKQDEKKLSFKSIEDEPSNSSESLQLKDQELGIVYPKDAFLLELPTAFNSSKNKKYNKGIYSKKHTNKHHKSNKVSTPKDKYIVDDDSFENSSSHSYIEPGEPKNTGNVNLYKNSKDIKGKCVKHRDNNQSIYNNLNYDNRNYSEWYNQLKFRMKQIEITVYLEEISKM
ncbi:LOW QUALITY PROTEIN: putative ATP-dependent RNA helicase DDX20 [Aphomia sociella]